MSRGTESNFSLHVLSQLYIRSRHVFSLQVRFSVLWSGMHTAPVAFSLALRFLRVPSSVSGLSLQGALSVAAFPRCPHPQRRAPGGTLIEVPPDQPPKVLSQGCLGVHPQTTPPRVLFLGIASRYLLFDPFVLANVPFPRFGLRWLGIPSRS